VKFYNFLDVGYGILEEWGYRIRDVFGRGRVLGYSWEEVFKGIRGEDKGANWKT
jgi:hypothetical protein